MKKKEIIGRINSSGITLGIFLILLGLFNLLKINIIYLFLFLILAGISLLIWRSILERKLK